MNKVLIRNQQEIALPDHTHTDTTDKQIQLQTHKHLTHKTLLLVICIRKKNKMSYVSRANSIKMISISVHLRIWLEARRRNGALI